MPWSCKSCGRRLGLRGLLGGAKLCAACESTQERKSQAEQDAMDHMAAKFLQAEDSGTLSVTMGKLRLTCPCGQRLRVSEKASGGRVRCPKCGQPVRVP